MHLATLSDHLGVRATVDEIIRTFDNLVDSGNICRNVHTYYRGCCISDKMFWALKERMLDISNSLFLPSIDESPVLLIHVTEDSVPRRITHISKGDKYYIFKHETDDIYLSLASECELAV